MAFYKKFQSKLNNLWYPKAITSGAPVTFSSTVSFRYFFFNSARIRLSDCGVMYR